MFNRKPFAITLLSIFSSLLIQANLQAANVLQFSRPTDTVSVSAGFSVTTAATYEAVILFTPQINGPGFIFNQLTSTVEDKFLIAGPNWIEAFSYPLNAYTVFKATPAMAFSVWHHVAYVYDGSQERLYVDGRMVASESATPPIGNGPAHVFIGHPTPRSWEGGLSFLGYMKSFRISNVARYSGARFTAPTGQLTNDANTLMLFNFDAPPGTTTVADASGRGAVGTLGVGFSEATSPQFVGDPGVSQGCQLNVTPALLQVSPAPWANEIFDDASKWAPLSPATFAAWACKLISSVMLINYQAEQQQNTFRASPDDLNTWLKTGNNSRTFQSSGNLPDEDIDAYVAAKTNSTLKLSHRLPMLPNNAVVNSYLCSGNPVILKVPIKLRNGKLGEHFVLATGQTSVGGVATFSINDPLHGATTLQQQYNGEYLAIHPYVGTSAPLPALLVTAHSPVELLATDPVGKRTGTDPVSGASFSQIPNSSYSTDAILDDVNPLSGATTPEIKTFEVLTPQPGPYIIQAIGSGTGTYTIDFQSYDVTGTSTTTTVAGSTIPGVVNTHIFNYSTPGTTLAVTVPCAADLNNDGLVNSEDLALVEASFGATKGQAKYNSAADVNKDGAVNIIDLSFVSRNLGCVTEIK